ncbi:uncharacterized protein LOC108912563 isoform X1 [Anoplophora glabripennis]|uniref:uncharacterized protein LOC108912563 isoform X1 n=1 Tax=Anoplophora glabripennis TaxID=217634 RepID=UPI0008744F2E|nr:uncharacterized protein LOC108912563 isoform X1 [Anoplophora glabripennis]
MNKISSVSPLADLKLCRFDPVFKTNSQYICYKYERCCTQGCCSTYGIYNTQSWYFWIIIAIILLIFYLGSWYCKKMDMKPKRRLQVDQSANRSSSSSSNSSPRVSPNRRPNEGNVDHLLNYLISCRLQNVNEVPPRRSTNSEPPPKYQEALSMPKLVRSNVQIVQIHADANTSTAQTRNGWSCGEIPPTYEDAVQISVEPRNTQDNV